MPLYCTLGMRGNTFPLPHSSLLSIPTPPVVPFDVLVQAQCFLPQGLCTCSFPASFPMGTHPEASVKPCPLQGRPTGGKEASTCRFLICVIVSARYGALTHSAHCQLLQQQVSSVKARASLVPSSHTVSGTWKAPDKPPSSIGHRQAWHKVALTTCE